MKRVYSASRIYWEGNSVKDFIIVRCGGSGDNNPFWSRRGAAGEILLNETAMAEAVAALFETYGIKRQLAIQYGCSDDDQILHGPLFVESVGKKLDQSGVSDPDFREMVISRLQITDRLYDPSNWVVDISCLPWNLNNRITATADISMEGATDAQIAFAKKVLIAMNIDVTEEVAGAAQREDGFFDTIIVMKKHSHAEENPSTGGPTRILRVTDLAAVFRLCPKS
jgi:hypothetical protein